MLFEEKVALDSQTLKLAGMIGLAMSGWLGANFSEFIDRSQPIMANWQVGQIWKILNTVQAIQWIIA